MSRDLIEALNDELPGNLVCSLLEIKITKDQGAPFETVLIEIKPTGKVSQSFSQGERVRRCIAEALLAIGGPDFHGILYEEKEEEEESLMGFAHRAFV